MEKEFGIFFGKMKVKKRIHQRAFTLIELLITVAIIGILILVSLFIYQIYMTRARDGRRKADLANLQRILEDYANDNLCYPDTLECKDDLSPYLKEIYCDPLNSGLNIYYYSVSAEADCKKWYKIFTNLEYDKDPIIEKVGCTPEICGPFNYLVASPNVEELVVQPGEVNPPWPPGVPMPTATPTNTPTDAPTATPTPTGTLTPTPTPTSTEAPTPTPTCAMWFTCIGQGGLCNATVEKAPGAVCSDTCNNCTAVDCYQPYPACKP